MGEERAGVPIAYVRLTLELAENRGADRREVLKKTGISEAVLDRPDSRIPLLDYGRIVARTLAITGDASLGYAFGLRSTLTSHGLVGLGIMSQRTLREALEFIGKYLVQLRAPGFTFRCFTEGEHVVVDVRETLDYGPLRQYALDMALVGFTRIVQPFVPQSEVQLWFDCPETSYYPSYRETLPLVQFNRGVNQLRCPADFLDRPVDTASRTTAQLVTQECERNVAVIGRCEDVLSRVRALLQGDGKELDLERVAKEIGTSSRTLKRRLRERGFTFRELVDEVRSEDGFRLLRETRLSVEEVAWRVGYSSHGNFIRAFRRWTGVTPAVFRTQLQAGPE